ncbi:FLYWCH-type zinc finger-containing protein 1-like, partial [Cochliomyia hominivorax]
FTDLEHLARKTGITITRGSKGKPKLVLAGYAYFRNNVKGSKTYWLCAKNRCNRCKARIITCSLSGELVIKNQEHNHLPNFFLINYPLEQNIFNSIQYVEGQRGSRKMVCGGYSYICAKIKKGRKYWVCAKQRSRNCKARLITDIEEVEFYTRNLLHNHATDVSRLRLTKDFQ